MSRLLPFSEDISGILGGLN